MAKIFLKEEIRKLEQEAAKCGISLLDLMENAGLSLFEEAEKRLGSLSGKNAVVLAGSGNNGGDGFCAAGLLESAGANTAVLLLDGMPRTQLAREAFSSLPPGVKVVNSQDELALEFIETADVVLDCVFGFGFRGKLDESVSRVFRLCDRINSYKISADLPSGTECDTARSDENAFKADLTVCFIGLKPAHVSYPARKFCGEVKVSSLGMPEDLLSDSSPRFFVTEKSDAASPLTSPAGDANKGDLGKVALFCGSEGMAGAAFMAARAALLSGAGLVRLVIPKEIYPVLAPALPQCLFTVYAGEDLSPALSAMRWATACVSGCGLGALAELLTPIVLGECKVPLVLDADSLNYISRDPEILSACAAPLLLTPHPGEMARLCRDETAEIQRDRLWAAREKARETGAVVVLKGAATVIASPDGRMAVNPTGNPGMAKGGSGDALAGILGSLLAQGISPFEAAVSATFVHGLAGDLAKRSFGIRSMLPTDLIDCLPEAFMSLRG